MRYLLFLLVISFSAFGAEEYIVIRNDDGKPVSIFKDGVGAIPLETSNRDFQVFLKWNAERPEEQKVKLEQAAPKEKPLVEPALSDAELKAVRALLMKGAASK